ncbi:MAG TPA: DUF1631 family protein [Moraxellaceae bacterium]|nr:DUF1631 family protein [Moraxellaceae bacterium]
MTDLGNVPAPRPEQRAHRRLPLQKNVLLVARGMKQRAGQMKEICAGGALVEMLEPAEEGRSFRRGEVVLLKVVIGEGDAARSQELRSRVAHVDGLLFGVAFFNPDPEALAALLAAADAAAADVAAIPPMTPETQSLIQERLVQQVMTYCGHALGPLLQQSDTALLAAAEHAHSAAEQRLFFEAATVLRKRRDDLRAQFIKTLKRSFFSPATDADADVSGLARADREQFEAWLVVKVMAARAEDACREPLQALQARLDALGHSGPARQFRPFAPASLCRVFQDVIAGLKFVPVVEKVLYRALEDAMLANLGSLYEALNSTLVQYNVMPVLVLPKAPVAADASAGAPPPPSVSGSAPPHSAQEFFARAGRVAPVLPRRGPSPQALRQLLALLRGDEAPAAVTLDSIELRRVFGMLKAADDGWRSSLSRYIVQSGDDGVAGAIRSLQPFVDALCKALVAEESPARTWLAALELPLLHALIRDDAFVNEQEHPLRSVMEGIVRLGGREAPLAAAARTAIEAMVVKISRDFDTDPDAIVAAARDIGPLIVAQQQNIERNRDRVCLAADGEWRLAEARREVQEALDVRLAGRKVPQPVLTLLDAGWRDLLVTTLLRQGGRGGNWDAYVGLIDELVAIAADPRRTFDLRALLQLLKEGLSEHGELNPAAQQQAIAELKPLLGGAQRLVEDPVVWVMVPPRRPGVDHGERWLEKWLERASRLQPGDWLELHHRGGGADYLNLAWRDAAGTRFVFVNPMGLKAGDFSHAELASLMHTGNAIACSSPSRPLERAMFRAGFSLYERLLQQVTHDPLTGLANRAEFMRQLDRVLEGARRQRSHHVLVRVSLDPLESDRPIPHEDRDDLERSVAHMLGKALAPRTLVARLGAGEFALLLEECELARAQQLISLRLGELSALRPVIAGEPCRLTASAGLVDVTFTSESAPWLIQAAEAACAEAQRHGGNRIDVHHPSDAEQARRDALALWVSRLNDALESERLALRWQRIEAVPSAPPTTLGYEILLGVPQEEGSQPLTGEFVQAAERYQRMLAVDRWVIENTFRWLRDNPAQIDSIGMVSLNLSAQSLADAQTPAFIFDRLLKYKLPPERFCFEISEAAAIANLPDVADFMQELGKAGCRFALDDFGTGHAGGGEHLRHLPLHYVKIDGAFVRVLGDDVEGGILLRAINALAHYVGLATIAENVEDAATLARLRAISVDYAQGYGIEKPRMLEGL